ncbi:hypothetical protein A2U01_0118929, partial [Trifolium medium]|nr:hypothetical protein [Trifolium medium]
TGHTAYRLFSPSEECLGHKESGLRKNCKPTDTRRPSLSTFQDRFVPLLSNFYLTVHLFRYSYNP